MTYSSSVAGRVRAFIGGLVLTAIAAIAAPFLLREFGVSRLERELLGGTVIAVAVIGILITVVLVFVTGPVRITTSPTHVEVYRGRRMRERWARAETSFSSFVVRESTNGIRTGNVRKLLAISASERVEVLCRWFNAETFNALIADVAPLVPLVPPTGERPAASAFSPASFTIDPKKSRLALRLALILLAIVVLAVVVGFLIAEIDSSLPAVPIVVLSAVLLGLIVATPLLRQERLVPRALSVSQSTLQFDDRVFPIGQLSAIRATPPGYNDVRRVLVLTETTGRTTRIPLGNATNGSFPAYGEFLESLRSATAHRPGLLTLAVA